MDLRHFNLSPAVSEVPDFVSSQDRERLIAAKQGDQSSQRTAQVLEEIMSRHPPSPFLEIEYAMAMSELHAPAVALAHFRKAQELLPTPDEGLDELIKQFSQRFEETSRRQHAQSLHAQYYQTWIPSKQIKFPLVLPRLPTEHDLLKEQWSSLTSQLSGPSAESFSEQYVRMLAIETNQVENVFLLSDEATDDLVKRGVAESRIDCQPESEEKDVEKIKSIVNDTLAAYDFLFDLAKDTTALTKETICDVHAHFMRTCRFSPHTYIPPGLTRSETRKTVVIQGQYTVQCCPFAEVDDELAYICKMAVQWIRTWRNPFGTASWLHLVLGRCHPFDEGNGRVSRIIASIPLVMNGYPPISVNLNTRSEYYAALDKAYSGDHGPLIECFVNGMQDTMASIQVAVA